MLTRWGMNRAHFGEGVTRRAFLGTVGLGSTLALEDMLQLQATAGGAWRAGPPRLPGLNAWNAGCGPTPAANGKLADDDPAWQGRHLAAVCHRPAARRLDWPLARRHFPEGNLGFDPRPASRRTGRCVTVSPPGQ